MDAVLILTTVPDAEMGRRIARALVEERLAACVNVHGPMTSVYRWRGAVEEESELQLAIKTTSVRIDAVRRRVAELHSYELPEFLVLSVAGGSDRYLDWLRSETT